MHILFTHRTFPGQFGPLISRLAKSKKISCSFLAENHGRAKMPGVDIIDYKSPELKDPRFITAHFNRSMTRAYAAYKAVKRRRNFKTPDLIVGHASFGTTLLLQELIDAPILGYFDYFHHSSGPHSRFRPELPLTEKNRLDLAVRNSVILQSLHFCDAAYTPTHWQKSIFPKVYRQKMSVLFDGIDTEFWKPVRRAASLRGIRLPPGKKIVTYVARGFEAVRGFDIFMRVAERLCRHRDDLIFICVGEFRSCYGVSYVEGTDGSWAREIAEQSNIPKDRIIFTGWLSEVELRSVLSSSDLHFYFTTPFVASWSLFNALACGAPVVASRTAPVLEIIRSGKNGILEEFDDVENLSRSALEVLESPALTRKLKLNAVRTIAGRYSIDRLMPQYLALLQRVTHAGRRLPS